MVGPEVSARRRRSLPTERSRPRLTFRSVDSPIPGLDWDKGVKGIVEAGRRSLLDLPRRIQAVEQELASHNPLLTLAAVSAHALRGDASQGSSRPFLQLHAELLQAFVLRRPIRSYLDGPHNIAPAIELVQQLADAYSMSRFAQLDRSRPMNELRRLAAIEELRLNTLAIRNWGYPDQVTDTTAALFRPIDDAIERELGIRFEALVQMVDSLISAFEEDLNRHFEKLRRVLRAGSTREAVRQVRAIVPNLEGNDAALVEILSKAPTKDHQMLALVALADLALPEMLSLGLDDIERLYPGKADRNALRHVMDSWSMEFGSLASTDPIEYFLDNPIWRKPIIRLRDEKYFWPFRQLFTSFALEMLASLLEDKPSLLQAYHRQRGRLVERRSEELIRQAFPGMHVAVGAQWVDPADGKYRETDIVALIDSHLVVVECKGGGVRATAKRGGVESFEDAVKTLVVEPLSRASDS